MSTQPQLIGHAEALAQFTAAKAQNHLHHGWIVRGPSGIGKSVFVTALAALMLTPDGADATMIEDIRQKIASGSHPDFQWVTRELNDKGQLKQDISVEQIRHLNHFFALKPALGGWRVGVIDALDEMNTAGLNAMLKTLEEPPNKAILFLISHGTQPLLATIRSRCQILRLGPLSDEETADVLQRHDLDASAVAALAPGRPGLALSLAEAGVSPVILATRALLDQPVKAFPDKLAGALSSAAASIAALNVFCLLLMDHCARRAIENPAYASIWLQLQSEKSDAMEINLTPLQTAAKLWALLYAFERKRVAA
ncbi:MAG: DNA polymerase III subunit delta' [Pseudomonadota bacterium]